MNVNKFKKVFKNTYKCVYVINVRTIQKNDSSFLKYHYCYSQDKIVSYLALYFYIKTS